MRGNRERGTGPDDQKKGDAPGSREKLMCIPSAGFQGLWGGLDHVSPKRDVRVLTPR